MDEDGVEPGASTGFIDCDGLDGELALQIRDTEPAQGVVSTQEWFIRASGKPGENFAFSTNAPWVVRRTSSALSSSRNRWASVGISLTSAGNHPGMIVPLCAVRTDADVSGAHDGAATARAPAARRMRHPAGAVRRR